MSVALMLVVVSCGADDESSIETLPPMRTTTTGAIVTTTTNNDRLFYEVQPGDNVAVIASQFSVPKNSIIELNQLEDGGQYLEIGQILEIPTGIRLVTEFPSTTTTLAE